MQYVVALFKFMCWIRADAIRQIQVLGLLLLCKLADANMLKIAMLHLDKIYDAF